MRRLLLSLFCALKAHRPAKALVLHIDGTSGFRYFCTRCGARMEVKA